MNMGLSRGRGYIANQVIQNKLFFFCVVSQSKCSMVTNKIKLLANVENSTMLREKTMRIFFTTIQIYLYTLDFLTSALIIDSSVCLDVGICFIFIKKLTDESFYHLLIILFLHP